MKKKLEGHEMFPEYDFRGAVRGKYVARFAGGSNVVLLHDDVMRKFPDSESVNNALRIWSRAESESVKLERKRA